MTRQYDWTAFSGYGPPTFTRIPNELLDDHLALLSGSEVKVLLYIARRTDGWNKPADAISLNQMLTGIKRKDGTQSDHGAGVSRATLVAALKSLVQKGLLYRLRADHHERTHEADVYALRKLPEEAGMDSKPAQSEPLAGLETRPELVQKLDQLAGLETEPTKERETKRQHPKNTPPPIVPPHGEDPQLPFDDQPKVDPRIQQLFDAWVETTEKRKGSTHLDAKRTKAAKAALATYPLDDLLDAVKGWRHDPYNRGDEGGKVYNEFTLCLRDAEHIERFRDLERGINRPQTAMAVARPNLRIHPTDARVLELQERAERLRRQEGVVQ